MSQEPQSIALFYTEGSSDKEYRVELRCVDGGWMTLGFNGRRGQTLKEQKKTPTPVDYDTAKKVYDKTVSAKVKKGYSEDVSGSIYQSLPTDKEFSGFIPQLLNTIREKSSLENFINSDDYIIQEKHDGERRPIRLNKGSVEGINKEGVLSSLPLSVVEDIKSLNASSLLLDGEIMGERYVVFDLLEINGESLKDEPYDKRLQRLEDLVSNLSFNCLELIFSARTTKEKKDLIDGLEDHCAEGFVIKKSNAKYAPSRPASGGSQLKYKFIETCSVRVSQKSETKRSVALEALVDNNSDECVFVGNVSIPSNFDIPNVGDIVNVEYLYKYENGSIYQPVFKGVRIDQTIPDDLSKFKYKQNEAFNFKKIKSLSL